VTLKLKKRGFCAHPPPRKRARAGQIADSRLRDAIEGRRDVVAVPNREGGISSRFQEKQTRGRIAEGDAESKNLDNNGYQKEREMVAKDKRLQHKEGMVPIYR